MTKDKALAFLEVMASVAATQYGIQHGLTQEKVKKFAEEIAQASRKGAETGKSNEEMKMVFSDIFKKYDLSDVELFKIEGG